MSLSLLRIAEVVGVTDSQFHPKAADVVLPMRIVVYGEVEATFTQSSFVHVTPHEEPRPGHRPCPPRPQTETHRPNSSCSLDLAPSTIRIGRPAIHRERESYISGRLASTRDLGPMTTPVSRNSI